MTWYADLGPIDYFHVAEPSPLRAVGWLDGDHPFDTGPTTGDDFERLCELLVEPWAPWAFAGAHPCELCAHTGGPGSLQFRGHRVQLGAQNVFVPAGPLLYVAPSLVVHYIDAHQYRPPEEFLAAVRVCPPMRSMDYQRALLDAGGRALIEVARAAGEPSSS